MFEVKCNFEDYSISSLESEDIKYLQELLNSQPTLYINSGKSIELNELQERFLEYYVSEGEFFVKIKFKNNIIGLIKGRLEFKNICEIWIWYFIIDNNYRGKGVGSKILNSICNYFKLNYGAVYTYTGVIESDEGNLNFFKNNSFTLYRISEGFFNISNESKNMLILKRVN